MTLEHTTAVTLKVGVILGLTLITVGLCIMYMGHGDRMLYAGVLLLVLSPFLGSIASLACLISQRDLYWATVAIVLVSVTTIGLVLNLI